VPSSELWHPSIGCKHAGQQRISGLIYLLTGGLFLIAVLYDFWTLNEQVSERNRIYP
jgi:hypothetical protein